MSAIKLDDVKCFVATLARRDGETYEQGDRRIEQYMRDFQDRTLDTVVENLESFGYYKGRNTIGHVLSLKNAQPEPEVDFELRVRLWSAMKRAEELRDYISVDEKNRDLDIAAEGLVSECEARLSNTETLDEPTN